MAGWELGFWAEALLVAECWVGEVERSVSGVGGDVSRGVEGDAPEVCEQHSCFVGAGGGDVDEACGLLEGSLGCEDQARAVCGVEDAGS